MKKLIIYIFLVLILCGCTKEIEKPKKNKKIKEETPQVEQYIDKNITPIGIYKLENNKLIKQTTINKKLNTEEEIGTFQIYPSTEEIINLNTNYGESFYNEWIKYNVKLGFNIKYTLTNNETISYNISNPEEAFLHWEYLMNYLYDDYNNRNKSFYSHIEALDENTIITSIKLQTAYHPEEITNIKLTVFTYDTEDDFLNNEYRGNSSYTININTE